VFSGGQGTGLIHDVPPLAELVARLEGEYAAACALPRFGGSGAESGHAASKQY
jgi:nitronate monooxygenase